LKILSEKGMGVSFKKSETRILSWLSNAHSILTMDYEQKGRAWGSLFKNEKLVAGYLS